MRKITFSINITIDGFADHTAGIADDELHDFFAGQLDDLDVILFGRKTYELMAGFWPHASEDPRSTKSIINFADKFNAVHKIVFSNSLKEVNWNNTQLINENLIDTVLNLRKQDGKNISAGSLSIAEQLAKRNLIDEYWFLIHPVILGNGKKLFESLEGKLKINLADTGTLKSGVVILHYLKA
jgi:dihydrofolate reductase